MTSPHEALPAGRLPAVERGTRQRAARSLLAFGLLLGGWGCSSGTGQPADDAPFTAEEVEQITGFCSRCHQPPRAEYFPKERWIHEVYRGLKFYAQSRQQDEVPPPAKRMIRYYSEQAPEALPAPEPIPLAADAAPRFRLAQGRSGKAVEGPAVADLSWKRWTADGPEQMVIADMRSGAVMSWNAAGQEYVLLAGIPHPDHLDWCDLDADGRIDLVVADLGSFEPRDHRNGTVRWLQQQAAGGFQSVVLASGLGRVADVRAGDFTGDGLLDLVVAEFGLRETGGLTLLEQQPRGPGALQFIKRSIDRRPGAMRVPPVDLDGDGKLDFVALVAQEFEAVEVFRNRGDGRFESQPLCSPADPGFGSSGMTDVDLDQDGDVDFLLTNGDMFDDFMIKPFHGLRWLENRGGKFVEHQLLTMPGAHGASVGDLDLDGDLDVLVANCFPRRIFVPMPEEQQRQLPSAVWLEQTAPGTFVPHALEFGNPTHVCHILADVDRDGDLDAVLGSFTPDYPEPRSPFLVFENLTRSSASED